MHLNQEHIEAEARPQIEATPGHLQASSLQDMRSSLAAELERDIAERDALRQHEDRLQMGMRGTVDTILQRPVDAISSDHASERIGTAHAERLAEMRQLATARRRLEEERDAVAARLAKLRARRRMEEFDSLDDVLAAGAGGVGGNTDGAITLPSRWGKEGYIYGWMYLCMWRGLCK